MRDPTQREVVVAYRNVAALATAFPEHIAQWYREVYESRCLIPVYLAFQDAGILEPLYDPEILGEQEEVFQ